MPNSSGKSDDETRKGFDFIGRASSEHGKNILFFSMKKVPILVVIYGGSGVFICLYSKHYKFSLDNRNGFR